jgi:hypothetical protein
LLVFAACCEGVETIKVSDTVRDFHRRTPLADLHSDFVLFHGGAGGMDAARAELREMRESGIGFLGASILGGGIAPNAGMRAAFWWFGWPSGERESAFARAVAQLSLIAGAGPS